MRTHAIPHHRMGFFKREIAHIKKVWATIDKLEKNRFAACAFCFALTILLGSGGLAFATFEGNSIFMALIIGLSVITLTFCVSEIKIRAIVVVSIICWICALAVIIYGFTKGSALLKPYL